MIELNDAKEMNVQLLKAHALTNFGPTQGYPRLLALTVLERCNLNCKMCYQNHLSREELSLAAIKKIEPILPFVEIVNITGGEPLLYKNIDHFFDLCQQNECQSCIQTNGLLLTKRRAEYLLDKNIHIIKISCDGATKKTYESIRHGAKFQKLVDNITTLQTLKKQRGLVYPIIEFNFVSMACNIRELTDLVQLAHTLGVQVINVFALRVSKEELIPESLYFYQQEANAYLEQARELGNRLGVLLKMPPLFKGQASQCGSSDEIPCIAPWESMTVNINGDVAICCGGAGNAGNLNTMTFQEVWQHPSRIKYRETVNTDQQLAACDKCRLNKPSPDNIQSHIPDQRMAEKGLEMFGHTVDHPLP